jgi:hypothetical protein
MVCAIPRWRPARRLKKEEIPMPFIPGAALGRLKHTLRTVGLAIALTLTMTCAAHATTVTLPAIDTNSNGWNTILMAYSSTSFRLDGYIKFDLSEIPVGSAINAATLEVHTWAANMAPIINVYHARNNDWAGPSVGPPGWTLPGRAKLLTTSPTTKNFPFATDFTLNVGALNWPSVLSEKIFSLVVHNENPDYSFFYMYGIDYPSQAPTLTLSYDLPAMPEPTSFALLATGGLPLLGLLRRRR